MKDRPYTERRRLYKHLRVWLQVKLALSLLLLGACQASLHQPSSGKSLDVSTNRSNMRSLLYIQRELLQQLIAERVGIVHAPIDAQVSDVHSLLVAYCDMLRRGIVPGAEALPECSGFYLESDDQKQCLSQFTQLFKVPGSAVEQCRYCIESLTRCLNYKSDLIKRKS